MKESKMKATIVRTFMIIAIFVVIGLSIVGFYYFMQNLTSKFPLETSNITNAANTNGSTNGSTNNSSVVSKANNIAATNQSYKDQVTKDINKYASNAGVSVANLDFTQPTNPSASQTSVAGVELKFVKITLANPIIFTNLMKFLKSIEGNLPKMQITDIDISPVSDSDGSVKVEPLTIGVYTKQ